MKKLLEEYGIDLARLIAGFFGGMVFISKEAAMTIRKTFLSLFTGIATANYLPPVFIDWMNIEKQGIKFAIAFLFGYLGVRVVEFISIKYILKNIKNISDDKDDKLPDSEPK